MWKELIDRLQTENRRAGELIKRFQGKIVLERFKQACQKYLEHIGEWEVVWTALKNAGTVPSALNVEGTLYAPPFPTDLEEALQAEITEVKRRAGL